MPVSILNDQGKKLGLLQEDGVFFKRVQPNHIIWRPVPSIAYDADAFDLMIARESKVLRVELAATGEKLETTTQFFLAHCVEFNRGFGRQYRLPIKNWTKPPKPEQANLL